MQIQTLVQRSYEVKIIMSLLGALDVGITAIVEGDWHREYLTMMGSRSLRGKRALVSLAYALLYLGCLGLSL